MIELGCLAGSSADACLSATPSATYTGFDVFREARPTFIFVDDMFSKEVQQAVETFLTNDVQSQLECTVPIDYVGDGLVIKLKG